jgi:hypothetical protein
MTPILIVIPYWSQDRDMAYEVCKLMVGMQPHHMGNTAHILLSNRQDCFPDQSMLQLCNQKFTTFQHHCQSPLRGWPDGANGMFGSSMIHVALTASHLYETVFWMEADCVPMCPNWFWDLVLAWRRKVPQALIVGTDVSVDGTQQGRHINGCALYHPNIARLMPSIASCSGQAWDWILREKIIQVSQNTELIRLMYNARNADPILLTQNPPVIVHGHKDRSLLDLVKQKHGVA